MEMLRRNIANMNELEMKGFIFDFIQKADGKKLERYAEVVEYMDFAEDIEDVETSDYNLTPEQERELDEGIAETYDPTKLISHEDVMKKYAKWLK
jgi:hypothetical protein